LNRSQWETRYSGTSAAVPSRAHNRAAIYRLVSGNQSSDLFIQVSSPREVRDLASQILSRDRDYPVIALTARPDEQRPALSVERIRGIVGPSTPIYFIPSDRLAVRLSHFLPRCLAVSGGAARLWWPGVGKDSRPEDHPKFYGLRGDYQEEVYDWLEGEFRPPLRPMTPTAPTLAHTGRSPRQPLNGQRGSGAFVSGMKILSYFAGSRPLGHGELASRAGISRSLAHRCLVELASLGYLTETRERRYGLAGAIDGHLSVVRRSDRPTRAV
jgi:hypothetical protein